jgi:hypothetical protein
MVGFLMGKRPRRKDLGEKLRRQSSGKDFAERLCGKTSGKKAGTDFRKTGMKKQETKSPVGRSFLGPEGLLDGLAGSEFRTRNKTPGLLSIRGMARLADMAGRPRF